ncbi:hypothetical protein GWN42_03230 [candidate division KSB1 bacterium]|nr:hypothetical protein [candidate division KSB1 bacterium]NIS27168.1 hypothetical protein [candidate division KSB1 bacterium]NIU27920.1 hypothetical protein [candidate division KSB1 bacterium]NIU89721.1 hypothetical protein [candidate division KSB1 bacterium]NIV91824.1 hypothetical protein [candidate division KSB1 bacterium]
MKIEIDKVEYDLSKPNRRQFLKSSIGLLLASMHHPLVLPETKNRNHMSLNGHNHPLIISLRLKTATPLAQLKRFYCEVLELPLLTEQSDEITVRAGETPVTFVPAGPESGEPFYHLAFNIPENKILLARKWQKERTPLFQTPDNLCDPDYPDDVRHFRHWNAHSIFFFDPAGNVLEYIARHDLNNASTGPFTSADILYASEIGFTSDKVEATALELRRAFSLMQYRQGNDNFRAIGDEFGLLLVFIRGRELGRGSDKVREADVFPTTISIRAEKHGSYSTPDYPYLISAD